MQAVGYNGACKVSDFGNVMEWLSIQAKCLKFDSLVFLEDINLELGIF